MYPGMFFQAHPIPYETIPELIYFVTLFTKSVTNNEPPLSPLKKYHFDLFNNCQIHFLLAKLDKNQLNHSKDL